MNQPLHHVQEVVRCNRSVEASDSSVLTHIYDDEVSVAVWQRCLGLPVSLAAGRLAATSDWRPVRLEVEPASATQALREALPHHPHGESLIADLALLCDMFATLFDQPAVGLRLTRLDRAMCPRFHIDKVPCRLVTTYVGPGTEWLGERAVNRAFLGLGNRGLPDETSGLLRMGSGIRQLRAGDVALLKGEGWIGNEGHGAVHRSPGVPPDTGRVVLTLDIIA